MITDSEIRLTGMKSLIDSLGEVQAERFITLVRRDNFDYTKWQENLFDDVSIESLSQQAQDYVDLKR